MKSDLDALMQQKSIDAILVTGPAQHNPAMVYCTGGGHMTEADVIKKRGQPAVLFHMPMERGEAAATGLRTVSYSRFPIQELLEETGGDRIQALALRYQNMLTAIDFTAGRLALYGLADVGVTLAVLDALRERMPEISFIPESDDSLLLEAMATKDTAEVERIRAMGKLTTDVVGRVAEFLSSQCARGDTLVDAQGVPLTIGDVKRRINLWLAESGAENPEGTIFSIGRDAGLPHSSGNPRDLLRLGQTIVFDIFPCEAGGGYFYDFTRTWCLGYAPDSVQSLYQDVLSVYKQMLSEFKPGQECSTYQHRACELFESLGHQSGLSYPNTEEGYVHSLGHGVGLNIHERPWFSTAHSSIDSITPGMVFTLEPGLYYPERGMGVRIEDTLWAKTDGKMEILAEYPLDLVIPIKGK